MEKDIVILPKGMIIKLNGFEAKLAQDTRVISPIIKEYGLENVKAFVSLSPSSNQVNRSKPPILLSI